MPQTISASDGEGISSRCPGGFHVIFGDRQVWFLSNEIPFAVLKEFSLPMVLRNTTGRRYSGRMRSSAEAEKRDIRKRLGATGFASVAGQLIVRRCDGSSYANEWVGIVRVKRLPRSLARW